ncbi:MAG: hypothetical protein B9S32_09080 [Verrucomicrobia bacterium Tous-C9LFEB]|nr:MAG: hypothetical protein B9S32_09080 [Verrucomicrobia bacterium Tous-C9LFEB]
MKNNSQWVFAVWLLILSFGVSGCGSKHDEGDGHDHGNKSTESKKAIEEHADHGGKNASASYQEGKGISLPEETQKSLGLELVEVGERELAPALSLTAQIYRASSENSRAHGKERSGNAYASALISRELAEKLAPGKKVYFTTKGKNDSSHDGTIWKIDSVQMAVLGKVEVLLELPDPNHSLAVGDFVEARVPLGDNRKTLAIPRTGLLETSTGTYAFVQNGDYLLRTQVKIGLQTSDAVEITEGLYEGDTVVASPVEALYLIELRATKGGGHCH